MADASAGETEPLKTQEEAPKSTLRQRFSYMSKHITVEPAGVFFLSASIFAAVCTQTLQLEKACRVNLNLGNEICTSLRNQDSDNNTQYEIMVQQYVATRLAWRSTIQSVIPCMILIFVGAWSDMTGRRIIVIIFPLIGEILQCMSNIINVIFFDELPVEVLIFFDVFFPAIMGGWSTLFLGLFSYIGDITTVENRTHRLGFVQFFTFVGLPIGMGLSGVVLKRFGYYAIYGTSLIIHLINIIYISIRLKDPERTKEQKLHDGRGFLYFIRTFFDFSNVKETIRVVFKKGPNKRRLRMIVLLSIVSILFGPIFGELAVLYMSTRYRFGWDELKFSMFQTYNFITHTLGTVFSLVVFSKALKWHDSVLGIISTLSKIAGSFIYCFAPTGRIFYLAPLVEILNGTSLLAMRSIVSKLVAPDELGKLHNHDGRGFLYFIRTFFDFSNVKETIRVVFKKGPNKRRLRMIVLLSIVSILFGPIFGELAVLYMSTRYRFGWDELKFSMFQTYNFITHTLGTVFSLVVFSKALKWHDSVLGIISTLSKIAGSFIYCFAPTGRIFYLAPLVEILNGTSLLAMRSIVSKLVAPDELGKVNSIFGLTENLMPLIYVPLYTTVYTATMEVLPGAVFLMGATMTTPAVAVFFWLFYEHRKGVRRLKKEAASKEAAIPLNDTEEIPLN